MAGFRGVTPLLLFLRDVKIKSRYHQPEPSLVGVLDSEIINYMCCLAFTIRGVLG